VIIVIEIKVPDLIEEALQAFNSHEIDAFVEYYAEDAVHYQLTSPEPIVGRKAIKEDYIKSSFDPFPDVKFELRNLFYQDDWICLEGLFIGTQKGPLGEGENIIPPTNRFVKVPICFVRKMKDGKMIEVREYNDQLSLLNQLGVM
jgi:predicted ester cyclase